MIHLSVDSFNVTSAGTYTIEIGNTPSGATQMCMQSDFIYGSGGLTFKIYLQTTVDNGNTWFDIASSAFLVASARKILTATLNATNNTFIATDGTLTDNTVIAGIAGMQLRIKYVVTGTYSASTCKIDIIAQ